MGQRGLDEGQAVRLTLGPSNRNFPGLRGQGLARTSPHQIVSTARKAWASLAGEGCPESLWKTEIPVHTLEIAESGEHRGEQEAKVSE